MASQLALVVALLGAAIIAVPLFRRLGLGSVLGYLIAGVAIGPFALGFIADGGQDIMHFAEFGVVMMLFLIGLELEPERLWRLRVSVIGMGGLQIVGTAVVAALVGLAFGLELKMAFAVGLIIAMSSTAIVMQTLSERGLNDTVGGRNAFAVLLSQDIAVIPILAVLPLLASAPASGTTVSHGETWVSHLPGWGHTLVVLAAIATVVFGGRLVVRPSFRWIARARMREVFTAAALLLVIAISLLMDKVGLSRALGAFLAGVVLASSEYRHELEGDIEPFKGLLLGLFFISVGASIDFGLIGAQPGLIAVLVLSLVIVKLTVLLAIGRAFRMGMEQALLLALALAQGGEFAFVLFSFSTTAGIITDAVAKPLVVAVAVSMAVSPLLMVLYARLVAPMAGRGKKSDRKADHPDSHNEVIIAGYGRFGQIVGRLLTANGIGSTVLEADPDQVEMLRKWGHKVFYGDASRLDLLHAAGAARAKLIVLALDSPERNLALVEVIKKHFPELAMVGRARGRIEAYELYCAGVKDFERETFEAALRLGGKSLRALGYGAHRAERAMSIFRRHDLSMLMEQAHLRAQHKDDPSYVSAVRAQMQAVEAVVRSDMQDKGDMADPAWDSEPMRQAATAQQAETRTSV